MYQLYNGDCLEVMRELPDNSVDLVLTDPPYGIANNSKQITHINGNCKTVHEEWDHIDYEFNLSWLTECKRLLKPSGSLVVFASHHNLYQVGYIIGDVLGMRILNHIVWYKRNSPPNVTCRMFTHSAEHIIWAVKGKGWVFNYWLAKEMNGGKQQREVFTGEDFIDYIMTPQRERERVGHPTQKPLLITEYLILVLSNEGQVVLDPFMGSGTTILAAYNCGRNAIGIEKDKHYYDLACERLKEVGVVPYAYKTPQGM